MERLLKKCEGVKFQVDVIYEYLSSVKPDEATGAVKTTAKTLESKRNALIVYREKYESYFEELCVEVNPELLGNVQKAYLSFEQKCTRCEEIIDILRQSFFPEEIKGNKDGEHNMLEAFKELINAQTESLKQITTHQQESLKEIASSISKKDVNLNAKLPKLDLKSFSGGYSEWSEFFDTFKSAVDSNSSLAPVQKLQYLKACLKGDAAALVKNLNLNDTNYGIALDLLKGRYENIKNIREAHLDNIFNVSTMVKKSASNIRKLCVIMNENIQALRNVGEPVDQWNSLLVYHCKKKLDSDTRFEWEKSTANVVNPTFKQMLDFLNDFAYALESSEEKAKRVSHGYKANAQATTKCLNVVHKNNCFLCEGDHHLAYCPDYTRLNAHEKKTKIIGLKLCLNCFSRQHFVSKCPKPASCRTCKKKHHPTLHVDDQPKENIEASNTSKSNSNNVSTLIGTLSNVNKEVLLATALVNARSYCGQGILCRVLVDPGSQSSFVTRGFIQRLRLKGSKLNNKINVHGIGGVSKGMITQAACIMLSSLHSKDCVELNALVIDRITSNVPQRTVMELDWTGLRDLQLADEHFTTTGPVDILLGADVYPRLILDGMQVCKSPDGQLLAQQSIFGWIITGSAKARLSDVKAKETETRVKFSKDHSYVEHNSTLSHFVETDDLLRRFWEVEEIPSVKCWSLEEKQCEDHFQSTTYRGSDGRYVVSLPLKDDFTLGESRSQALNRLLQNERRLSRDSKLRESYNANVKEYLQLHHAERVPSDELNDVNSYYMPHHGVVKDSSSTTKLRVVFDASAKSSTGTSLNDCLMIGPKVQDDLFDILMRFRIHPIAFSADIAKMYRQVELNVHDRNFHRFLWREDPSEIVREYRMTRVTFGVASSAYHAQRVLVKLANDEEDNYPLASPIIKRDMYMDDCLSGAADIPTGMETQRQLIDMLKGGGFNLRKWSSNSTEILEALPQDLREMKYDFNLDLGQSEYVIKTLGMYLCPLKDEFLFKVQPIECLSDVNVFTKRQFLADSSRLFDPLGLLAPVLVKAKIMFQKLWLLGVSWDDPLAEEFLHDWRLWRTGLTELTKLRVSRCLVPEETVTRYELHGFCDASESAYAAVVYLRTLTSNGDTLSRLIAAKTKVAPLKKISLPRLELCGAHLLAKLMRRIQTTFCNLEPFICCWTDSMVALCWIRGDPNKWKTFVGNRVSQIQDLVHPSNWYYCPTEVNPADIASRGVNASEFLKCTDWFGAPAWLSERPETWPRQPNISSTEESNVEHRKSHTTTISKSSTKSILSLFQYSSFMKVLRVLSWCRRWSPGKTSVSRTGPLTTEELKSSLLLLVKDVQSEGFSTEIDCLKAKKTIPCGSKLISLNPFLDKDDVLRVGGRLDQATMVYDRKYPIILPKNHELTRLIIDNEHLKNLHAGPQLLLATLRQKYWIIGARNVIRQSLHKCVTCRRNKATSLQQIMGVLPKERVTPKKAFNTTGVDYAGPVLLKIGRGRGRRNEKAWIALFVCLAVKAVHLELVTSLSTEAFLAAFRRFISRRGKPSSMFSDNGTNFVGANRELRQFISKDEHNDIVRKALQQDQIEWHFMPQKASHFGGLWEAGVKSVKYHLRRVVGDVGLTFEEMSTVLCQIEACLNSRPLTAISTDPSDLQALTPGHFLIGEPLNRPSKNPAFSGLNFVLTASFIFLTIILPSTC